MSSEDLEKRSDGIFPQKRLFSFLAATKKIPPLPSSDDQRSYYPESRASFISKVFFWWINPLLSIGYVRTLQPEDLFMLTDELKVSNMYFKFVGIYSKLSSKNKLSLSPTKHLIWTIISTFRLDFFLSCVFFGLFCVGSTLNPLLLKHLINFVESRSRGDDSASTGKGVGYAIGTSAIVFVCAFFQNHGFQKGMMVGSRTKAVLTKAVIAKSFKLSDRAKHEYPTSRIISMLGADLSRIDMALGYLCVLITFPLPLIISIVILIVNIGVAGLVGVILVFLFLLSLTFATKRLMSMRNSINVHTDERLNIIQEILSNLRMIKFYSWEIPYFSKISSARNYEMDIVLKMQALRNLINATAMSFSNVCSMVAFLVLYALNGNNNAGSVFSSLSLFNVLAQQVYVLPLVASAAGDAFVAARRVSKFLMAEENEENSILLKCELNDDTNTGQVIKISNARFEWPNFDDAEDENGTDGEECGTAVNSVNDDGKDDKDSLRKGDGFSENANINNEVLQDKDTSPDFEARDTEDKKVKVVDDGFALRNIDLNIEKGEFIVITGAVGCGKTSLLHAIAGMMPCKQGSLNVSESLLFCNSPWIQNATVRDNILFGSEYDQVKYNDVIKACCLDNDLQEFEAGDHTEVGERGITLSGGQKARISLARAVYANRQIILLDDVLSAVDAKVGKNIMNNCILGLLKNKTRVLATHQISLIGQADRIIFFNGNGTIEVGTLSELEQKSSTFKKLLMFSNFESSVEDNKNQPETNTGEPKADEKRGGKLMVREDQAVNGVSLDVYKTFIKYGSGSFTFFGWIVFYLSTTTLTTFCQLFSNTWLSFWIQGKFPGRSDHFYMGLYIMFTFLTVVFLVNELLSLVYLTNTASRTLHILAIKRVLHAPMSYLDTTPMGRIINRFSRDTEVLDNEISNQLRISSFALSNILGVIILCIIYLPWFAIAVPFMAVLFVGISSFYQASSREIKRLDSVKRSFVYSSVGEMLSGMDTMKIYNAEEIFTKKLELSIDKMNEAYYLTISLQRWISVNLNVISTTFALIISFLCVFKVFNIGAASVGLVLSYTIQITTQLNQFMRAVTQVENEMNSLERISHYALKLEQEAPYTVSETAPPPLWPSEGKVTFDDVCMSYRPGLPLVLKNLTFTVEPGQRIGICGRTGAGKSSIMSAFFRLAELSSGKIIIDDIDCSLLGLHQLRSKLSIIPQDPVLFKGTIRRNLDPFSQSSDEKMIEALQKVGLLKPEDIEKTQVGDEGASSKFLLDQTVDNDGLNFSLGEKQLVSFARALVRESKILILDEATSSVDYENDSRIQSSIMNDFKHCTILCIAHRLRTILHYDKILVMEKGMVEEFDSPLNLFSREDSVFRSMCDKSDITLADFK